MATDVSVIPTPAAPGGKDGACSPGPDRISGKPGEHDADRVAPLACYSRVERDTCQFSRVPVLKNGIRGWCHRRVRHPPTRNLDVLR